MMQFPLRLMRQIRAFVGTSFSVQLSFAVLVIVLLCVLFPQYLAPQDPYAQSLIRRLKPPAFMDKGISGYWLGTDQLGRDTLSRIIFGARYTFLISLSAVVLATFLGTAVGLLSGYFGGWVDIIALRLIDMQLAFPVILLVIAIVSILGPSIPILVLLMALSSWPQSARIVRASVLSVREREYITAAKSIGLRTSRILWRYILPNVLSPILVFAAVDLSRMMLIEATLSYLGLGVQPPTPTWGAMITEGQKYLNLSWAASVFPGLAIGIVILAVNILGDRLRDRLDPRLSTAER